MNEKPVVVGRKTLYASQPDEIVEFLPRFRPFKLVVEATASYHWFVELVEPLAEKVLLANPKKLRVIAESTKKTDRLDAQILAEFLARDMVPVLERITSRRLTLRTLPALREQALPRPRAREDVLRVAQPPRPRTGLRWARSTEADGEGDVREACDTESAPAALDKGPLIDG